MGSAAASLRRPWWASVTGASGFFPAPIKTASRRDRFAGYKRALRAAGIEFDSARVWAGSGKSAFGDPEAGELGRLGARALLTNGSGVTAIVAVNDMYALGAYAGIRSVGLSVPNDVSVIGFDDIALTTLVEPPLSTIRQPVWEMAETAVRRLVACLDDDAGDEPLRAEFAPELVMRGSAAPVQLAAWRRTVGSRRAAKQPTTATQTAELRVRRAGAVTGARPTAGGLVPGPNPSNLVSTPTMAEPILSAAEPATSKARVIA